MKGIVAVVGEVFAGNFGGGQVGIAQILHGHEVNVGIPGVAVVGVFEEVAVAVIVWIDTEGGDGLGFVGDGRVVEFVRCVSVCLRRFAGVGRGVAFGGVNGGVLVGGVGLVFEDAAADVLELLAVASGVVFVVLLPAGCGGFVGDAGVGVGWIGGQGAGGLAVGGGNDLASGIIAEEVGGAFGFVDAGGATVALVAAAGFGEEKFASFVIVLDFGKAACEVVALLGVGAVAEGHVGDLAEGIAGVTGKFFLAGKTLGAGPGFGQFGQLAVGIVAVTNFGLVRIDDVSKAVVRIVGVGDLVGLADCVCLRICGGQAGGDELFFAANLAVGDVALIWPSPYQLGHPARWSCLPAPSSTNIESMGRQTRQ
jgi:hypothetical protein